MKIRNFLRAALLSSALVPMAFGTTAISVNFKQSLFEGGHNFKSSGGIAYKALLIKVTPTGTYDSTLANVGTPGSGSPSTVNVGTDETSGAGYTSLGVTLTNTAPTNGSGVAYTTPAANPSWTSATFSATGMVIYTADATIGATGRTVGYWDFGSTQSVSSGTFTVVMPTNASGTALIRIG